MYQCVLEIAPWAKPSKRRTKGGKRELYKPDAPELNEVSALVFNTEEEAQEFGERMFEPPLSVVSWRVKPTLQPANFKLP